MFDNRHSALADNSTVKEVACVKLNTREVCVHLKNSAAYSFFYRYVSFAVLMAKAEVVVIASCKSELFVVIVNSLADCAGCVEVKSCSFNRSDFACRD